MLAKLCGYGFDVGDILYMIMIVQYDLIVVLQMEPDLQVLRLHFDFNYWNVV